ncbi:MAG: hypothetical protein J6C85_04760 [Alphaproteobacteria bacterium]|nr:hypothetical protein [Alphaproteobacteria bacterium]
MYKFVCVILSIVLFSSEVLANAADFAPYFKVDMKADLPDIDEYIKKLDRSYQVYDRGYISRTRMGTSFNKEFSRIIKFYGLSEGRLKSSYEDDLLEVISWLPKEAYQYIGPMLHEVPGMSEKILNLPGIKETKNKFPEDIAERFKAVENLEFMSPSLYFLLMPEIWDKKKPEDADKPQITRVKKPRVQIELPDFLKEKINAPAPTAQKQNASALKKKSASLSADLRTLSPTLTSPLTAKDVAAFVDTIDEVMEWGMKDDMRNYSKLISAEMMLDFWEAEQGTALSQNTLKDIVNPCQRLVLKTRFAGLYYDFSKVVSKQGFTPEEWAYTCDKTIKGFRAGKASLSMAYALKFHRNGYYDDYLEKLPKKWRDEMYQTSEAFIKMYAVLAEDVKTVQPFQKTLFEKFTKIKGIMLTAPIIY